VTGWFKPGEGRISINNITEKKSTGEPQEQWKPIYNKGGTNPLTNQ